jgi:Pyridoxamine 5'-phosphate oxidase
MPTKDEDRVLETLDDAECRRLLGTARVGRLGFTVGALPEILPVPFTLDGDCIRVASRLDDRLVDAVRRSVVVVAVDSYDVDEQTGWGVTVVGPSSVLSVEGRSSIVVPLGLVRGWRLSLPTGTGYLPLAPVR